MKRALTFLFAVILLSGIQGCFLCGNGEPICGAKPSDDGKPSTSGTATIRPAFYQERAGYTCTPAGSSVSLPSWVASIEIGDDGTTATLRGDRCQPDSAATTIRVAEIEYSIRRDELAYKDGIFTYYATQPPPGAHAIVETWCQAKADVKYEVIVDTAENAALVKEPGSDALTLPVVRSDTSGTRVYSGTNVRLTVDASGNASLDQAPGAFYTGAMTCRLGN